MEFHKYKYIFFIFIYIFVKLVNYKSYIEKTRKCKKVYINICKCKNLFPKLLTKLFYPENVYKCRKR